MISGIIITVLIIFLGVSLYAIFNLLRKQERAEDLLNLYDEGLTSVGAILVSTTDYLKELDSKGHFQADDELGEFFKAMKEAQDTINKVFVEHQDRLEQSNA